MSIDKDKLEDLKRLLKNAYIEGYRQGTVDERRGDFWGGAEDRWSESELCIAAEIVEMGG